VVVSSHGVYVWSSLGSLPGANETEISVMGPGHGESIVVHLGKGEWLVVDSCIDMTDSTKPSAPLKYLQNLGVNVKQDVKLIVVTHWDDDHFRGVADLLEACPNAEFWAPQVYSQEKFTCFIEAISSAASQTDGGNVDNIRRILHLLNDRGMPLKVASPSRQLFKSPVVRSWSPSDLDSNLFLEYIASLQPTKGQAYRKAIPATPNLASVVLTIEWSDYSVLLGADMERSSDNLRGWGAVVAETNKIGVRLSDYVKIPHHGSTNADDKRMWTDLLQKSPISVIAPFGKGSINSRPPTANDIKRVRALSNKLYLTARHTIRSAPTNMSFAVKRSLREGMITLSSKKNPIGIVRSRRLPSSPWKSELLGAAFGV
jgi:beta-lactamase superfamily II metal-dependent hydrolase